MAFDQMRFGIRIREGREKMGLTQEELAEKVGVSKQHICRIETGYRTCSYDLLLKISDVLGASTDYLLRGEEKKEGPGTREEVRSRMSAIIAELTELQNCL